MSIQFDSYDYIIIYFIFFWFMFSSHIVHAEQNGLITRYNWLNNKKKHGLFYFSTCNSSRRQTNYLPLWMLDQLIECYLLYYSCRTVTLMWCPKVLGRSVILRGCNGWWRDKAACVIIWSNTSADASAFWLRTERISRTYFSYLLCMCVHASMVAETNCLQIFYEWLLERSDFANPFDF